MKEIYLASITALSLTSSLPAIAGPDWQVIERARAEHNVKAHGGPEQTRASSPCVQGNAAPEGMQDKLESPKNQATK